MNNIISATMHFETTLQEPYKPIHISSQEDTPENIAYCANCPHDDCIYQTLDQCKTNECASKGKYTKTKKWVQRNIIGLYNPDGLLMPIAHAKHN